MGCERYRYGFISSLMFYVLCFVLVTDTKRSGITVSVVDTTE